MWWSWEIELGYHQKEKNRLGVADPSSNQCAWGSINLEKLYGGYSRYSTSGLLLALYAQKILDQIREQSFYQKFLL